MVLCRKVNPLSVCHKEAAAQHLGKGDFEKSDEACACIKIVGCDHLKSKRARKFQCRSQRIKNLAQPKHKTAKYCVDESMPGKSSVEIVRAYEEETPVRIKMLSYPKVRKLVSSRDAYKNIVDKQWHGRFEHFIHRSMDTMYSRLANVQPPSKSAHHKKWNRADWAHHCEWLKKRAGPRPTASSAPAKRKKVPIQDLMQSMLELSQPRLPRKKFRPQYGYKSTVKPSARSCIPSDRIMQLAEPKQPKEDEKKDELEPFHVNPRALAYQPSKRKIFSETQNFTVFFIHSRTPDTTRRPESPQDAHQRTSARSHFFWCLEASVESDVNSAHGGAVEAEGEGR